MKRTVLSLVFALAGIMAILVAPATSKRSEPSDTDVIIASERAWAKAPVDGDADAMASYMADDYIEIFSDPTPTNKNVWKTTTKANWVELVRSKREKYTAVELHNIKVYLHGSVATTTGGYSQTGTEDGKDISASGFYIDTWVKENGKWKVVSSVFP